MKQRKVPMRKCTGCGEMKEKKQLVRVVKAPDETDENGAVIKSGEISVDLTGKKPGRGAYICKSEECLAKAKKSKGLERSFKTAVPGEVYLSLAEELKAIEEEKIRQEIEESKKGLWE